MKLLLTLILLFTIELHLVADEAQNIKDIIVKVEQLKEKNDYDGIIKVVSDEINNGKLYSIYFDIVGGAYAGKENNEEAYLSYLRGYLYNPLTEYSRTKLQPKMKYIENRSEKLDKNSWLSKYLTAKKQFDDGNYVEADRLIGALISENKNADVACILSKDIKSFKDVSKDAKMILNNLTAAESDFNRIIAQMGNKCPEFVEYEFADLLYKAGKYDQAIEYFKRSIDKNQLRRDNLLKYGICQLYIKNYSESKRTFLKCVEKSPDYADAQLYLGFAHWACKESDKAVKVFKTVIDLCQTSNPTLREKARKAMDVVNKGDLFLTPDDVSKIVDAKSQSTPNINSTKQNEEKKSDEKPVESK